MTNQQIQTLALRHRNSEGFLDLNAVMAERRALKQQGQKLPNADDEWRKLRRLQAWPEHLIDQEIREMKG